MTPRDPFSTDLLHGILPVHWPKFQINPYVNTCVYFIFISANNLFIITHRFRSTLWLDHSTRGGSISTVTHQGVLHGLECPEKLKIGIMEYFKMMKTQITYFPVNRLVGPFSGRSISTGHKPKSSGPGKGGA